MIDERINNSLRELEQELSNIESARKEVEETVSAYEKLKKVTANYVSSLNAVKKELDEIVNLIGEDYSQKSLEFEKDRTRIVESCDDVMHGIKDVSSEIEDKISSNIGMIKKIMVVALILNILTLIVVMIQSWLM